MGPTAEARPDETELTEGNTLQMPLRRIIAAVAIALGFGAVTTTPALASDSITASMSTVAARTPGFVSRSGDQLMLNGKPWMFAGYNLPCANPFVLSDAALGFYLDNIKLNSGANAIRVWFFQSQGGPGNWTNFNRVLSALDARGMKAVVTLTNETSTCDEPRATTFYKTVPWYQNGYQVPEGGYRQSFQQYAAAVARHFWHDPGVAFWQLVNEAQAPSLLSTGQLTCDETAARDALRAFADNMTSVIRRADPNHLVNLGTQGSGQCGIGGPDYGYVHAGRVDLCEYHDYGEPGTALPATLVQDIAACQLLGKPLFVGESGIPADIQSDGTPTSTCDPWPTCAPNPVTPETLEQRATFFAAKLSAARQANVAGYLIWVKSPFYSPDNEGYAVGDGDPTETALIQFTAGAPPPMLGESKWAPALAIAAVGTIVVTAATMRRQRKGLVSS
jgi:hypothetical protein